MQYALAASSSTGYTVVWDLRGKREVAALAYGGGAGTQAGVQSFGAGLAVGGRRGMSDVAWHPDNVSDCYFQKIVLNVSRRQPVLLRLPRTTRHP